MKKLHLNLLVACAALVSGTLVFAADSKPPEKQQSFDERYKVIWEQNMFLKERKKPGSTTPRNGADGGGPNGRGNREQRAPETLFALRGVVFEEGQNFAYFEDMTTAKMLRLIVGDSIAKGRIAEIEIDAVAYEAGGQITWVSVGTDLRGKAAVLLSTPSYETRATPTTTSTASTSPATADGSGGAASADGSGAATDTGGTGATTAADPSTMSIEEKMRLRRLQGK